MAEAKGARSWYRAWNGTASSADAATQAGAISASAAGIAQITIAIDAVARLIRGTWSPGRWTLCFFARQHVVHHLASEAKIAGGIAHRLELGAGKVLGDLAVLREQLDQRLAGGRHLAADVVDQIVRPLPPEMRAQPHHHRFRNDHAEREIEIGAHAPGVD